MGISELVVFMVAPIVFLQDFKVLQRDGFMPLLNLVILSFAGCAISCVYNHTPFAFSIKGLMANYGLFAAIVVCHRLVRQNPDGCKWYLLGVAISFVLSTFIFQGATELAQYGQGAVGKKAVDGIMSGPLFWSARIGGFWVLPYKGWYMATPQAWNVAAPLIWGIVSAVISQGSGRSMAISMIGASFIILCCGKSRREIRKVSKHIGWFVVVSIIFAFIISVVYKETATRGMLGEKAQRKYEAQVKGANTPLKIIMAGRSEFFVGIFACCKNPFFGYGPWPMDKDGIYEDWINKYGNYEDAERFYQYQEYYKRNFGNSRVSLIPAHSVIISFWLSYGIMGLLLWIYILYRIWNYLRNDIDSIPHYIGWLAAGIPGMLWTIFFSPFAMRLGYGMFISMMLLCSAAKKGVFRLPDKMLFEIENAQ